MEPAGLLFLQILRIIMAIPNEPRYNKKKVWDLERLGFRVKEKG